MLMGPSNPRTSSAFKRPYASRRKRKAAKSIDEEKHNKLGIKVLTAIFVLLLAAIIAMFFGLEQSVTASKPPM